MTHSLFDNAKFGDIFITVEKKQAVFLRLAENAEYKFAILYVEDWGMVQVFRHNGKEIRNDAAHSIISKQEEPVSEKFEEALAKEWKGYNDRGAATVDTLEDNTQELAFAKGFYRGAKWQKEQMIKDAVDACVTEIRTYYKEENEIDFTVMYEKGIIPYEMEQEVKLIIIKED